jgi:hypothetical protein
MPDTIGAAAWLRQRFERVGDKVTPLLVTGVLAVVAALVGSLVTRSLTGCPPRTPSLLSVELSFSAQRLAQLKTLAGACDARLGGTFVHWDLLFPWCYAAALSAVVIWTERWLWAPVEGSGVRNPFAMEGTLRTAYDRFAGFLVVAPWLAAILDVFGENLPLYLAWGGLGPPPTFPARILVLIASVSAAAKWTLLGAVAIWIVVLLLSGPRGWVLWRTRFSALAVLLGSVPLLVNDQGQDVLASIAETRALGGLLPGVAALLLGAFAAWWCARVLLLLRLPDERRPADEWERYFEKEIPRILGVVVMVLGAAALARVAGEGLLQRFLFGGLGLLAVSGMLRLRFEAEFKRVGGVLLRAVRLGRLEQVPDLAADLGQGAAVLALFTLIVVRWHPAPTDDRAVLRAAYALRWALLATTWLAVLFYIYVYRRRRIWAVIHGQDLSAVERQLDGYLPRHTPRLTRRIAAAAGIASALLFVSFLYRDTVPVGQGLGPFVILCLAAANAVLIGSATVVVGRVLRLPLVTIGLAFAVLFSRWNDNHLVALGQPAPARPSLAAYYARWLEARAATAGQAPVPVVLVAASGGGLRAAYWTAHTLSVLSDSQPAFARSVFAISGVSGGSLGAAVYASLVKDRGHSPAGPCFATGGRAPLTNCSHAVLGGDFLSPVLARLVATDFTQNFLPWPWRQLDRSRALEASWAEAYRRATGDTTFRAERAGAAAQRDPRRDRPAGGRQPVPGRWCAPGQLRPLGHGRRRPPAGERGAQQRPLHLREPRGDAGGHLAQSHGPRRGWRLLRELRAGHGDRPLPDAHQPAVPRDGLAATRHHSTALRGPVPVQRPQRVRGRAVRAGGLPGQAGTGHRLGRAASGIARHSGGSGQPGSGGDRLGGAGGGRGVPAVRRARRLRGYRLRSEK